MLLMEVDKGQRSFWHPFLASIPQSYTTLAYFEARHRPQLQASLILLLASELLSSHTTVPKIW